MSSPDALAAFKANPGSYDLVISDRGSVSRGIDIDQMKPVATGYLAKMVRKVLDEVAEGKRAHDSGQADAITL
jgi:hypothetical protein